MVDINIGGKQYKVPAQHIGGIMNAQSAMEARAAKTAAEAAEAERLAGTRVGGLTIPEQEAQQRIAKSKRETELLGQPTPKERPLSTEIAEQKFQQKTTDRLREIDSIVMDPEYKNEYGEISTYAQRSRLAQHHNMTPEGDTFYFPTTIEVPGKYYGTNEEDTFEPIRVPYGATKNNVPITKEVIIEQYNLYGRPANVDFQHYVTTILNNLGR